MHSNKPPAPERVTPESEPRTVSTKAHGSYIIAVSVDEQGAFVELRDGLNAFLGCISSVPPLATEAQTIEQAKDRAATCIELLALLDEV